jgi:hypothetical protein
MIELGMLFNSSGRWTNSVQGEDVAETYEGMGICEGLAPRVSSAYDFMAGS